MSDKLTAAERYAALKRDRFEAFIDGSFTAAKLKGVQLFEVKCPSGMVFKCRRPDAEFAAMQGQMPMAIANQFIAKRDGGDIDPDAEKEANAAAWDAMSEAERRASIEIAGKMVRYVAVSPRILFEVGDHRDAIAADAVTLADFEHLAKWAQGGDAAEGLRTFRRKRR